jgi:hypothetical protein
MCIADWPSEMAAGLRAGAANIAVGTEDRRQAIQTGAQRGWMKQRYDAAPAGWAP